VTVAMTLQLRMRAPPLISGNFSNDH
jgi:hypothetical protein